MILGKWVAAVGIGLLLAYFLSGIVSTFYEAPKVDLSSCYSSSSDCYTNLREQLCGGDIYNYSCTSQIYSSPEYQNCVTQATQNRASCIENQQNATKMYQAIFYSIIAILGIIFIILGFLMISGESIGSGFILGGVLTLLFGNFFASISILMNSLFSGLSSLTGLAVSSSSPGPIKYLTLVFNFIAILVLIIFAHFKLEKREESEENA